MFAPLLRSVLVVLLSCSALPGRAEQPRSPQVLVDGWELQLVAADPVLVTPTGCCVGPDGSLYVIECNTHFPPDDYQRSAVDRILRFTDEDGDGTVETPHVFYEGSTQTMNVIALPDGALVLATRSSVTRIRDTNGDGVADETVELLQHDTPGDYPHNGLGGLTMGPDGRLYVGQGENLGEPYALIGSDGSRQKGHGEGGNVFSCTTDGTDVQRVATGFWNPFGLTFDATGRLLAVGNDPDSMPPNRLLHVVPTADFGFQFRFGRAGTHPLQSWNGEFPGTLPIAAATGEAACAVLVEGRTALVTSWGDNRIERFVLAPHGATVRATADVAVQGDADFRPVGLAKCPDGSLYVTDWVDRSYPVHGRGRLWQLKRSHTDPANVLPQSEREIEAASVASSTSVPRMLEAADSEDVYLQQAAVRGLVAENRVAEVAWSDLHSPGAKVALLNAARWVQLTSAEATDDARRHELLAAAINDPSEAVALSGIRWATENRDREREADIAALLKRPDLSPRLFAACIASLAWMENGSAASRTRDPAIEQRLVKFLLNADRPHSLRALALRQLSTESVVPTNDELLTLTLTSSGPQLNREVVRFLATRQADNWPARLAMIARNTNVDSQTRADAMTYLIKQPAALKTVVDSLATSRDPVLLACIERLQQTAVDVSDHPAAHQLDDWMALVGQGGDAAAGHRVFLRRGCVTCHQHNGRGAKTGPDLTTLAGSVTRRRLLESVLQPSREIGPLYVPWLVETTSGKVVTGFKLDRPGKQDALRFVDVRGQVVEVPLQEIASRTVSDVSLMPAGQERLMTIDELRDLLAFLEGGAVD